LGRFDDIRRVYIGINKVISICGGFVRLWLVKSVSECLVIFIGGGLTLVIDIKLG